MIYYYSYSLGEHVTGANLFYRRIAEILRKQPGSKGIRDMFSFMEAGIKRLLPGDILVTNNGPYAFLPHYYRQRFGLRFRILRDVQTTLHGAYLFQEAACGAFQQPGDAVIFPSNYTRNMYLKLFTHLNEENTFVCYPCIETFPKPRPRAKTDDVGYLGRCSQEKNFQQLINIAPKLKCKILVAGELNQKKLPENMVWVGNLPYKDIWNFLGRIRVLLFPSTANIESLGRVLLEANHARVPAIAAEFGASPELCPNLIPVKYRGDEMELLHSQPLGLVNEEILTEKIKSHLRLGENSGYQDHDKKFLEILAGSPAKEKRVALNPYVEEFISRTKTYINAKYNFNLIGAICNSVPQLKKEDIGNLGQASHNILEKLGFKPTWKLS